MSTTGAVRRLGHHISGRSIDSPAGSEPIARRDPARGELVAQFAAGSGHEADLAVAAARTAFDHGPWPRMCADERAAILRAFANAMAEEADLLAGLDSEETGKPLRYAQQDIQGAIGHIRTVASLVETLHSQAWPETRAGLHVTSRHAPAGVAVLIIPWNFPAGILCQKLPYALGMGCTVVVKPSEFTSSSALHIARIAQQAGVPDGVINVVTGLGSTVGAALCAHEDVDFVSFTGSTATGRHVAAAAGGALTRVGLELGGKGAHVIFADADLEQAAQAAVFGGFFNSGQVCVAAPRILVHESVAEEFTRLLTERTLKLVVADPRSPDADLGPVIHEQHLKKVLSSIDSARSHGARVLCGGTRLTEGSLARGMFLAPTVLDSVPASSPLFREEVFGPVVSLTRFSHDDEAVALTNATPYGLAHTVWTSDVGRALSLPWRLRSGTVWVNTHLAGHTLIPFGGTKSSGWGSEGGLAGLLEFSYRQTLQVATDRRDYGFGAS